MPEDNSPSIAADSQIPKAENPLESRRTYIPKPDPGGLTAQPKTPYTSGIDRTGPTAAAAGKGRLAFDK